MQKASAIQKEIDGITTVKDLTGVFESISSTRVAKVKGKVALSQDFFNLLWKRYQSLRLDPSQQITNRTQITTGDKGVYVIVSAEAGLSGDIDDRLIETMLRDYDASKTDVIVLGTHGATQLKQRGIDYIRHFQIPESDGYIDVSPIIQATSPYSNITIYYEDYVSLGVQEIKRIDLASTIREMSTEADANVDVMTDAETIFEPSIQEIAGQMEAMMMKLALSQVIFDSSLAQDASRFNAMAVSKKRAIDLIVNYNLDFHRSKRAEADRRSREVMVSLKKKKRMRQAR